MADPHNFAAAQRPRRRLDLWGMDRLTQWVLIIGVLFFVAGIVSAIALPQEHESAAYQRGYRAGIEAGRAEPPTRQWSDKMAVGYLQDRGWYCVRPHPAAKGQSPVAGEEAQGDE